MSRRTSILIFVAALVLIDALARFVTGTSPSLVDEAPSPRATPVVAAGGPLRSEFVPLLIRAKSDARALVELGETKDRNLLRIHTSQSAMEESLDAADAWLAANAVPPGSAEAVAAYRDGAASIRFAMEEAQAGFLRLDFGRVARATETMRKGEEHLEASLVKLQSEP